MVRIYWWIGYAVILLLLPTQTYAFGELLMSSGSQCIELTTSPELLIHSNTTDGSTTFTDSSSNNHTVTVAGDTEHSTDQQYLGTTSMWFDGGGDYLSVPETVGDIGASDFTISYWTLDGSNTGLNEFHVSDYEDSGGSNRAWYVFGTSGGYAETAFRDSGGTFLINMNSNPVGIKDGNWHHIEITRSGSNAYLFIDGTIVATDASASGTISDSVNPVLIGGQWAAGAASVTSTYRGYIDELVIIIGEALHTSNFTPPALQYCN